MLQGFTIAFQILSSLHPLDQTSEAVSMETTIPLHQSIVDWCLVKTCIVFDLAQR